MSLCTGLTSKGKPCSRKPTTNSTCCWQHALSDKSTITPSYQPNLQNNPQPINTFQPINPYQPTLNYQSLTPHQISSPSNEPFRPASYRGFIINNLSIGSPRKTIIPINMKVMPTKISQVNVNTNANITPIYVNNTNNVNAPNDVKNNMRNDTVIRVGDQNLVAMKKNPIDGEYKQWLLTGTIRNEMVKLAGDPNGKSYIYYKHEIDNIIERWLISMSELPFDPSKNSWASIYRDLDMTHPINIKFISEIYEKKLDKLSDNMYKCRTFVKKILEIVSNNLKDTGVETTGFKENCSDEEIRYDQFVMKSTDRIKQLIKMAGCEAVTAMLIRYDSIINQGQQWGPEQWHFDDLYDNFGVKNEGFASPLNSRLLGKPNITFCSLFPDVDSKFGSFGNFFNTRLVESYDNWWINPPFITSLIDEVVTKIEGTFVDAKINDILINIFMLVPDWVDSSFHKKLRESPQKVYQVELLKGKYNFMTSDGKIIPAMVNCTYFILSSHPERISKEESDRMVTALNKINNSVVVNKAVEKPAYQSNKYTPNQVNSPINIKQHTHQPTNQPTQLNSHANKFVPYKVTSPVSPSVNTIQPNQVIYPIHNQIKDLFENYKKSLIDMISYDLSLKAEDVENIILNNINNGDSAILKTLHSLFIKRENSVTSTNECGRPDLRIRDMNYLYIQIKNKPIVKRYIDLGGGNGTITSAFAKYFKTTKENSISADIGKWYGDTQIPKVNSITDITFSEIPEFGRLPFEDNSFDVMTCLMSLHHMDRVEERLIECYRIMNKGGFLMIREHNCIDRNLKNIIDLKHYLYEMVFPETFNEKFLDEYKASYHSKIEWTDKITRVGFKFVNLHYITASDAKNPTRIYHAVYQKV
jgi:ubiquinone/menaquinone biosynthesis C-methylase UbiE